MSERSSLITLFVGKISSLFPRIRWGKLFFGKNVSLGKFYIGENFSHLTKISSLFPNELFLDKVCFKIKWAADNGVCTEQSN